MDLVYTPGSGQYPSHLQKTFDFFAEKDTVRGDFDEYDCSRKRKAPIVFSESVSLAPSSQATQIKTVREVSLPISDDLNLTDERVKKVSRQALDRGVFRKVRDRTIEKYGLEKQALKDELEKIDVSDTSLSGMSSAKIEVFQWMQKAESIMGRKEYYRLAAEKLGLEVSFIEPSYTFFKSNKRLQNVTYLTPKETKKFAEVFNLFRTRFVEGLCEISKRREVSFGLKEVSVVLGYKEVSLRDLVSLRKRQEFQETRKIPEKFFTYTVEDLSTYLTSEWEAFKKSNL